jgi:hypothetical protein
MEFPGFWRRASKWNANGMQAVVFWRPRNVVLEAVLPNNSAPTEGLPPVSSSTLVRPPARSNGKEPCFALLAKCDYLVAFLRIQHDHGFEPRRRPHGREE